MRRPWQRPTLEKPQHVSDKEWAQRCELAAALILEQENLPVAVALSEAARIQRMSR